MPTTATKKTTLLQTTQDSGSMGGFSGPMCLSGHMTEMGKMAGKNFFCRVVTPVTVVKILKSGGISRKT